MENYLLALFGWLVIICWFLYIEYVAIKSLLTSSKSMEALTFFIASIIGCIIIYGIWDIKPFIIALGWG